MKYLAKIQLKEGGTSIVFRGLKLSNKLIPPGRVCIKVMESEQALVEAKKHLVIEDGYGSLIELVSTQEVQFTPSMLENIRSKFHNRPVLCLILKFIDSQRFIFTEPLQYADNFYPGEWLIQIGDTSEGFQAYKQGFVNLNHSGRVRFIRQLIKALHRFHSKGEWHGDISPQNILFTNDTLQLVDYGGEFTQGSPGWSPIHRGMKGDLELVGMWIQRTFARMDTRFEKLAKQILEMTFEDLAALEEAFEKAVHAKKRFRRLIFASSAIGSVLLLAGLLNYYLKPQPNSYQHLYNTALNNPQSRYTVLSDLRQRFHNDSSGRNSIHELLIKLGSKDVPKGPFRGFVRFKDASGAFYGDSLLQPGDLTKDGYIFDAFSTHVNVVRESGKRVPVETIPLPFSQLTFGCYAKGIETTAFLNAIAVLANRHFVNYSDQTGIHQINLFLPAEKPTDLLARLAQHPGLDAEFEGDFLLNNLDTSVTIVSHPKGTSLFEGALEVVLNRLNIFDEYELRIPTHLADAYVPSSLTEEVLDTLGILIHACKSAGLGHRIEANVFTVTD